MIDDDDLAEDNQTGDETPRPGTSDDEAAAS
jgi:hypothetical protein